MGRAPEIKAALGDTREWVLDPATGQIGPEQEPAAEREAEQAQPQPEPVQAAYQTYD